MSRIHRLAAAASTALLLAAATAAPATAAQPSLDIAALGDSYAAGYGIALPTAANPCAQSSKAYALRLSPGKGDVEFLACSGATTATVLATQVGEIDADADVVTLTVGGNDVRWGDIIRGCLTATTPEQARACQATLTALPTEFSGVGASVAALVGAIHKKAPGAKVLVTGYPKLFQASPTNACAAYSAGTQLLLGTFDALAVGLNASIEAGATSAEATFVDVTGAFAGHGVCDADPWLFSPDSPGVLHPTVAGQNAYARELRAAGAR